MPPGDIHRKSEAFNRTVRRGNLSLLLGPLVVLTVAFLNRKAVGAWPAGEGVAGVAILAAVSYVIYQIYTRGPAAAVPPDATPAASLDLYRAQLERRRDTLRGIWRWYAGPILGALMVFALRPLAHLQQAGAWAKMAPFLVLSIVWSVAVAQQAQRAAGKLQEEIDGLKPRSEDSENHS